MSVHEYRYEDIPEDAKQPLQDAIDRFYNDIPVVLAQLIRDLGAMGDVLPMCTHVGVVVHVLMIAAARSAYAYFKASPRAKGLLDDTHLNAQAMDDDVLMAVALLMEAVEKQATENLRAEEKRRDPSRN